MTELILGTAQFGAGYGVTNQVGRIDDAALRDILDVAEESGISTFDTAPDYGDAQSRLGRLADPEIGRRYVSKFTLPSEGLVAKDTVLAETLSDLRVPSLSGLLFHRVADLRDERAPHAWDILRSARERGIIGRIGASIYDADDLVVVADRFTDLDLIQIPGNVLDRRLVDNPLLRRLHDRGVEVHVRSVYLQGVLLADPDELQPHFAELRPIIASLRESAAGIQRSVLSFCLGYLKNHPVVDGVLVGATNPGELGSTVAAWKDAPDERFDFGIPELSMELLDPRSWPPRGRSA